MREGLFQRLQQLTAQLAHLRFLVALMPAAKAATTLRSSGVRSRALRRTSCSRAHQIFAEQLVGATIERWSLDNCLHRTITHGGTNGHTGLKSARLFYPVIAAE